jgi:hypothetical protein
LENCKFHDFSFSTPTKNTTLSATMPKSNAYSFNIDIRWDRPGKRFGQFLVGGWYNKINQNYGVTMTLNTTAPDLLGIKGFDMTKLSLTGEVNMGPNGKKFLLLEAVFKLGSTKMELIATGALSSAGVFFKLELKDTSIKKLFALIPWDGLQTVVNAFPSVVVDAKFSVAVQYGKDPRATELIAPRSGIGAKPGTKEAMFQIKLSDFTVYPWPGVTAAIAHFVPGAGAVASLASMGSGSSKKGGKKKKKGGLPDSVQIGNWQMGTYQDEAPKEPNWGWKKTFGTADVFAGVEAALDYGIDFSGSGNTLKIDARFFAGGSLYVEAFTARVPIVEAYAKVDGKVDTAKCKEMLKRDKATWTEEEKEANQVKFGAYAQLVNKKYSIGYKLPLCSPGSPCLPEPTKEPEMLHDFGTYQLFKLTFPFMAGPIPVSFAVGCNILMALYFKVEGRMGVPALLEHEKALWGA